MSCIKSFCRNIFANRGKFAKFSAIRYSKHGTKGTEFAALQIQIKKVHKTLEEFPTWKVRVPVSMEILNRLQICGLFSEHPVSMVLCCIESQGTSQDLLQYYENFSEKCP